MPSFFDIQATAGITIKVVPNAPKHPNIETHIPLAPASPLNNLYTITKKVRAATVLKALNIKKVVREGGYPNSDSIMERGVLLPLHHGMTEDMFNRLHETITEFIKKSRD